MLQTVNSLHTNRSNPRARPAFRLNELLEGCLKLERKDFEAKGRQAAKILRKLGFDHRQAKLTRSQSKENAKFWFWPDDPSWLESEELDSGEEVGL